MKSEHNTHNPRPPASGWTSAAATQNLLPGLAVEGHRQILTKGVAFAGIVFLLTVVVQWLVYDFVLRDPGGIRLIAPMVAALSSGAFVVSLNLARRRERISISERLRAIVEMNHHIRNALQVMVYHEAMNRDGESPEMQDAIRRIEWTLHSVVPLLANDKPIGSLGESPLDSTSGERENKSGQRRPQTETAECRNGTVRNTGSTRSRLAGLE